MNFFRTSCKSVYISASSPNFLKGEIPLTDRVNLAKVKVKKKFRDLANFKLESYGSFRTILQTTISLFCKR